jgi:hypothetical protein
MTPNPDVIENPYPGLGRKFARTAGAGSEPIIVTARFRSGSTLLWNLFRNMNGFTAYYEPHNERRWFDPQLRGIKIDPTHRNVTNYWEEYEGLEHLERYYREDWIRRDLFMDADFWDPDLLEYTRQLIEKAPQRPVLQCNHIDFRLAWFRRHFPSAQFIHLYRHPREQWCSSLLDQNFPSHRKTTDFSPYDGFYLLTWARDLKHRFPFLDQGTTEHPYQLFYFIWKLSYMYGRQYADYSLSYENLVNHPHHELERLLRFVGGEADGQDLARLVDLIGKPSPERWRDYAEDDWFLRHESMCETTIADFFAEADGSVRDRGGRLSSGCHKVAKA